MHNKIKSTLNIGVLASGTSASLLGIVSDFLVPVAPNMSGYIAIGLFLLLLVSVVARSIPFTHKFFSETFRDSWYFPLFVALIISTGITFAAYNASETSENGNGYLSERFNLISDLQGSILNELTTQTKELKKHTDQNEILIKETTTHTSQNKEQIDILASTKRELEEQTQQTEELKRLLAENKKETSTNPRKEIVNLGSEFSATGFQKALQGSDKELVDLFLVSGMSVLDQKYTIRDMLLYINTGGYRAMLHYLIKK